MEEEARIKSMGWNVDAAYKVPAARVADTANCQLALTLKEHIKVPYLPYLYFTLYRITLIESLRWCYFCFFALHMVTSLFQPFNVLRILQ